MLTPAHFSLSHSALDAQEEESEKQRCYDWHCGCRPNGGQRVCTSKEGVFGCLFVCLPIFLFVCLFVFVFISSRRFYSSATVIAKNPMYFYPVLWLHFLYCLLPTFW